MQVRKLPVVQGFAWLRAAVDLGARNPKAVFGAALLFIALLFGFAMSLAIVAVLLTHDGGAAEGPDPSMVMLLFVPLYIGLMVLLPILIGGLMHVIREAEAGRPVRARDLFAPLRTGHAKALAALGVLQVVLALVGAVLITVIAGPTYWQDYLAAVRSAMSGVTAVPPQPRHPGLLFLVQFVHWYFTTAITLFAVPLVMFSRASLWDAVRGSLRASVQNVGANLLAAMLFVLGTIAATIVVLLLVWMATLIGNLLHPAVGMVLAFAIQLGFGAALLVVLAGGAYLAWRDTFDAPPPTHPFEGIEA